MPEFTHAQPENYANGQELPPLKRMRRMDMIKLANAYGIQHPPNAKKDVLLPLLEIALGAGQIGPGKTPPYPEFLLSAGDRRRKLKSEDYSPKGYAPKWRGPHDKWCVMDGEEIVQKGLTKVQAVAACG